MGGNVATGIAPNQGVGQPSQGMSQAMGQGMGQASQQPMQGPFGGLGNMQVSPYSSTSQQNIFGGQQFGFQQPQPFYQQQFNPYAMQRMGMGIQGIPMRNQYGPYGGQMGNVGYPQPMGYPQQTMQQGPFGGLGNMQVNPYSSPNQNSGYIGGGLRAPDPLNPVDLFNDLSNFYMTGQSAIRQQRTVDPNAVSYSPQVYREMQQQMQQQMPQQSRLDPTAVSYSPQVYREMQQQMPQQSMPQQSAINFQQQITDPQTGRTFDLNSPVAQDLATSSAHARAMAAFNKTNSSQQQFDPNQAMHHGMFSRYDDPMPPVSQEQVFAPAVMPHGYGLSGPTQSATRQFASLGSLLAGQPKF